MPNLVENKAMEVVTEHLVKRGFHVTNVSRGKRRTSEHKGYDILAEKDGEAPIKIEVKGCTRPWGIPDPYATEFANGKLVADFLYVVYLLPDEPMQLCIIPRDALKAEHVRPKAGYRISSRFKKESVLKEFLKPL